MKKVILNSQFKAMKATPTVWSNERFQGSAPFLRKGIVGDWKAHFIDEQAKLLEEKFRVKLAGTEAEYFWDKHDCWF